MQYWTALALGFVGSLHCAGMCGPLALALPVTGHSVAGFAVGRVAYNLGRLVTYTSLGLLFGFIGQTLLVAGLQRWVSIGLGVALLLGLVVSRKLALSAPIVRLLGRLKLAMSGWLQTRTLTALAVLGGLTGLLPCGLVYVACAGAAATDHWHQGALYMFLFGLGTVPMMLGIGLSGRLLQGSLRIKLRHLVPVSVLVLGALLILRGLSLGIPYLSPDLSHGACSCHAPNPPSP
jgi:sulfite exporter TauE/SafE